jgi:hypothetical protein
LVVRNGIYITAAAFRITGFAARHWVYPIAVISHFVFESVLVIGAVVLLYRIISFRGIIIPEVVVLSILVNC